MPPEDTDRAASSQGHAQISSKTGLPALSDTIKTIRNRLIASPSFQKWAFKIPGVRAIARKRSAKLFDLVAGFVYSQVLYACVRLDIFNLLSREPLSLEDLAKRFDMEPDAAERLLKAAVALDLLDRASDGRFMLGAQGAAMVGNPWIEAMVEHHAHLYVDLADPIALLNGDVSGGQLAAYWPYAGEQEGFQSDPDAVSRYSELMARSQVAIAAEVLDSYNFAQHRHVLDAGGGEGVFLSEVLSRHDDLQGSLMDLPAVAARAEERLNALSLQSRTTLYGQSFYDESWPTGHDLITFIRILHDHDDPQVKKLLCAAYNSLPKGGTILIAEPLAGTKGAEAMGDAYFGIYLKAMGSGRPRTMNELKTNLHKTGFIDIQMHKTRNPLMVQVLTARRE